MAHRDSAFCLPSQVLISYFEVGKELGKLEVGREDISGSAGSILPLYSQHPPEAAQSYVSQLHFPLEWGYFSLEWVGNSALLSEVLLGSSINKNENVVQFRWLNSSS